MRNRSTAAIGIHEEVKKIAQSLQRQRKSEPGPGRARAYALALPQSRTCPIEASGSSGQGFPYPLGYPWPFRRPAPKVQCPRRVARPRVPDQHLPSLPWVPAVQVPQLPRYYEDVRLPPSLSPRFVAFAWRYPGVRLSFAPSDPRRQIAGQGLVSRSPYRPCTQGDDQGLPSSRRILMYLCPALRPRQDRRDRSYIVVGAAPAMSTTKAPTITQTFEAQSHGFDTRCLRFVRCLATRDARLASRCLPLYGTGLVTRRILTKGFRPLSSPLPELLGARTSRVFIGGRRKTPCMSPGVSGQSRCCGRRRRDVREPALPASSDDARRRRPLRAVGHKQQSLRPVIRGAGGMPSRSAQMRSPSLDYHQCRGEIVGTGGSGSIGGDGAIDADGVEDDFRHFLVSLPR